MPATWTQLSNVVAAMMGDVGYVAFDASMIEAALLSSAREIAAELQLCEETTTITTVAATADYILDASSPGGSFNGQPYRVKKAFIQIQGYNWRALREESDRPTVTYVSADLPRAYSFRPWSDVFSGPTITFNPVPNNAYSVKIIANCLPSDSSANPNGPSLPFEAEQLVMLRAIRRLRGAEGNMELDADFAEEDAVEVQVARSGRERASRGAPWR